MAAWVRRTGGFGRAWSGPGPVCRDARLVPACSLSVAPTPPTAVAVAAPGQFARERGLAELETGGHPDQGGAPCRQWHSWKRQGGGRSQRSRAPRTRGSSVAESHRMSTLCSPIEMFCDATFPAVSLRRAGQGRLLAPGPTLARRARRLARPPGGCLLSLVLGLPWLRPGGCGGLSPGLWSHHRRRDQGACDRTPGEFGSCFLAHLTCPPPGRCV